DHPEIRDVIVSGGDPLTLPVPKLRFFLENLSAIKHVDVIRIGTRVPVTLPQKLYDRELIDLLASAEKVWIQTHFNHPREITPEAARVCKALLRAGMPVNNHTVLLKGVNDSLETMRQLMRGLLRIKVRPYYLFHCDPVIGAGHFRTSVWKGLEIMERLRQPGVRRAGGGLRQRDGSGMRIGITYDLKTSDGPNGKVDRHPPDDLQEEFDSPATVEAIAEVLRGLGHDVDLLGDGRELLE